MSQAPFAGSTSQQPEIAPLRAGHRTVGGAIPLATPAESALQPPTSVSSAGGRRGSRQAQAGPRPGTGSARQRQSRTPPRPRRPSRPWAGTSGCRHPRRRIAGPRPKCDGSLRTRTPAHTTDGTDESPERFAPHPRDQVSLTARSNALVESFHGLYKWELIYPQGPWAGLEDVELATLSYVDWFNDRRLRGEITDGPGYTTPAAFEAAYYRQTTPAPAAGTQQTEPLRNPGRFSHPHDHRPPPMQVDT